MFCLCDSKTNYLYNFEIFSGDVNFNDEGGSIAKYIVHKLSEPLADTGHHIFMDKWYSSPILFQKLQEKGIRATGLVSENAKGIPKDIIHAYEVDLIETEIRAHRSKNLLFIQWKDLVLVNVLSTVYDSSKIKQAKRNYV